MQRGFSKHWLRAMGLFLLGCVIATSLAAQPPFPKGKGAKKDLPEGEFKTVQGTVRDFTTAPKGETDGLILNDGTFVHWPPHLANRFTAIAAKGDRVKVAGFMDAGPKQDDPKLEVSTLTNLRTSKTVENPDRPVPARAVSGRSGDVEQRLQALEDKIDELTQEVRRLRAKK